MQYKITRIIRMTKIIEADNEAEAEATAMDCTDDEFINKRVVDDIQERAED